MGGQHLSYKVVEVVKDLDKDRYITYDNFCAFIKELPAFSRQQAYFLLLGITGFRPVEVARLTISDLEFSNPNKPVIINRITKTAPALHTDSEGNQILKKVVKIKRRLIPIWVRRYIEEYVNRNYNRFGSDGQGSFYMFTSRQRSKPYTNSKAWSVEMAKWRNRLIKKDSERWAWTKEPAFHRIIKGKSEPVYCLSLYSFRKSRATWHGMELLKQGIPDILINVCHFMGHERFNTTYRYLKSLIAERSAGELSPITSPDLNKNFLKVGNPESKVDTILKKITSHPKFLKVLEEIAKGQD